MANAGSTLEHVSKKTPRGIAIGKRVRELYKALGWTQESTADRSGELLTRTQFNRIVCGESQLGSAKQRDGLAVAFGLTEAQIKAFIEGRLSVDDAVRIIRAPPEIVAGAEAIETHNPELAAAISFYRGLYSDDFLKEYAQTARRNGTDWNRETYRADILAQHARRKEPATTAAADFEAKPKLPKKGKR